ncbi:MAG: dTMP kinase, partial [Verrucomicrobiaceae bacterium]|nr:dTMP kinase [Verrucomicrobiaceae bacterium]
MSQRGIFISFEGVDGCGKSAQIKELRRRLRSLGDKIVLTREPGGTLLGEDIRKILQRTSDTPKIGERAELLLFTASRAQLVDEMLAPALSEGRHVIADRFLDSTTIYQGVAR